jgi:hypothetical protein
MAAKAKGGGSRCSPRRALTGRRLAAAQAFVRELERDTASLRTRTRCRLDERTQARYAAFVKDKTGIASDRDIWVAFASYQGALEDEEARLVPARARAMIDLLRQQQAARVPFSLQLPRYEQQTADTIRWLEEHCASAEEDTEAEPAPPLDGGPGPAPDAARAAVAHRLVEFLRRHCPRCRPFWQVAAAVMALQGWDLGPGPLAKQAERLRKRVT